MAALIPLILAIAQTATVVDFPNQDLAYDPIGAPVYELALVRFDKRTGTDKRAYTSSLGDADVEAAVDQFDVLDSSIEMPKRITTLAPVVGGPATPLRNPPGTKLRELRHGQVYLLVTAKAGVTELKWPIGAHWVRAESGAAKGAWTTLSPRKGPGEFMALAVLATKAKKLLGGKEATIEKLMENVANCLAGADLDGVQRACRFLSQSRYKPQFHQGTGMVVPRDGPFIPVMQKAIESLRPHLAARVAAVLSNWNVEGGGRLLYESISKSYDDPNLFSLPGDPYPQGGLDYHVKRPIFDEAAYQAETDEEFDMSLKAKSPVLREFLIQHWGNIVDVERRRKALLVAEGSRDRFDRIAGIILHKFAFWYRDGEKVPIWQNVKGDSIMVNKSELFKYWRTMLGMGIKSKQLMAHSAHPSE